jgi:hypothetical protein
MAQSSSGNPATREYLQLLRLHEALLNGLQSVRAELSAPDTAGLVKEIKARTGSAPDLAPVKTAVEEAIRALKMSESEIQGAVVEVTEADFEVDGISNMPAYLKRFLAERSTQPGFSYDVSQDEVRGWVVRWKEYTHKGTVRGYGQFYERPYAWLED